MQPTIQKAAKGKAASLRMPIAFTCASESAPTGSDALRQLLWLQLTPLMSLWSVDAVAETVANAMLYCNGFGSVPSTPFERKTRVRPRFSGLPVPIEQHTGATRYNSSTPIGSSMPGPDPRAVLLVPERRVLEAMAPKKKSKPTVQTPVATRQVRHKINTDDVLRNEGHDDSVLIDAAAGRIPNADDVLALRQAQDLMYAGIDIGRSADLESLIHRIAANEDPEVKLGLACEANRTIGLPLLYELGHGAASSPSAPPSVASATDGAKASSSGALQTELQSVLEGGLEAVPRIMALAKKLALETSADGTLPASLGRAVLQSLCQSADCPRTIAKSAEFCTSAQKPDQKVLLRWLTTNSSLSSAQVREASTRVAAVFRKRGEVANQRGNRRMRGLAAQRLKK